MNIYKLLFDKSEDAIIITKKDQTILNWNHAAEKIYGWKEDEAIGQINHKLLKTQFPVPIDLINKELTENYYWSGRINQVAKNGNLVIISASWSYDKENDIIIKINRNLAPLSQLYSKEIYETVFNSIPHGICVTDIDGNIIFYNNEIVNLLGPQVAGEKADSRKYGFFLPDQKTTWPSEQLPLVRTRKSGKPDGGIMFVQNKYRPAGVWITNYAYPLREPNGIIIGVVAVLKEIVAISDHLPSFCLDIPPHNEQDNNAI